MILPKYTLEGYGKEIKECQSKGKAEGKFEGKVETARAALLEGLNIDMICKITGLPLETVMELKKELEN